MLPTSGNNRDSLKQKRSEEEEKQEPRHTRGIHVDYRYPHNPFPNEDGEANEATFSSVIARDELKSLKEAKSSPDWLEWDKVIQTELAQLQQMGLGD